MCTLATARGGGGEDIEMVWGRGGGGVRASVSVCEFLSKSGYTTNLLFITNVFGKNNTKLDTHTRIYDITVHDYCQYRVLFFCIAPLLYLLIV